MSDDLNHAADEHSVATASYVSTAEILERESRLLARRQLARPGFWRPFVRRRVLAAVLIVAVIVALAVFIDGIEAAGAVRGIVLMLLALGLLTAVDVWLTRRGILRAHRVLATAGCPPGTVVTARYTPREFTFSLPGHRLMLETTTLTGGLHEGGLLWLEQADDVGWVVPDELLGVSGLDLVRTVLGERLVER
ncbi:MAG TPA: hypothetical protein VFI44_14175 [Ornithinibacter sp.]|nr:hypothetical protein [Ornithinibacter sp.]